MCDAPFSNLDDANLESCAKVLARERQLIVFVNNQSYKWFWKDAC